MKKLILTTLALSLFHCYSGAQLSFSLVDDMDTTYLDMETTAAGHLAGLRYDASGYKIDLRQPAANSFGTLQHSFTLTGYYEHLLTKGNFIYPVGYHLQAVDITNPASPLVYPKIDLAPVVISTALWDNFVFTLNNVDGFNYKLHIFSVGNPANLQEVDSLLLPADGVIKIAGNKLYYFCSNQTIGDRISTYQLSVTAPYVTFEDSLVLNTGTAISLPLLDLAGNQLLAKTADSIYRFRINGSGPLQLLERKGFQAIANHMVALDTNTVCYSMYQLIQAHALNNNATLSIDSAHWFNSFRNMGRLGNNIFYTDYLKTYLVSLSNLVTAIPKTPAILPVTIGPNPSGDHWRVRYPANGTLQLHDAQGRALGQWEIEANKSRVIDAHQLAPGVYYYKIHSASGSASGKLIRK